MKGFIALTLLSIIFVSDYAMAQFCPCDTLELENGTTGNEIIEQLCPGGHLGTNTEFFLDEVDSKISSPTEGYGVESSSLGGGCGIFQDTDEAQLMLLAQESLNCRNSLIKRCGLNVNPIPTLSQWGMISAAVVLGMIGLFVAVRRRKAAHS